MKKVLLLLVVGFMLQSCYTHKHIVGQGPKIGVTDKAKQHNFVYGLASGKTPSIEKVTGKKDLKDYKVETKHSFIDGLISQLTFGIYTPTTVKVTY